MVGTRALAWFVLLALVTTGAVTGCGGGGAQEGSDRSSGRPASGVYLGRGDESVRSSAYLEHGGHRYDLMAGECPSGTEGPDDPSTQPETPVASRITSAYPESITLFQEVHVPTPDDPEGLNAYIDLHGETPGLDLPHQVHAATGLDPVPAPLGTAGEAGASLGYSDVYSRFPSPVQVMEPGTTVLGATWETPTGVMNHLFRIHSWTEWDAASGQLEFYFTIALDLRWQGWSIWSWNSGINKGRLGYVNYVSGLGAGVCGAFTVTRWTQATPGEVLPPAVEVSRKTYEQRELVFAQPFGEIDIPAHARRPGSTRS